MRETTKKNIGACSDVQELCANRPNKNHMNNRIPFRIGIIILTILSSCDNSNRKRAVANQSINYGNKAVLDSLIKTTPHSKDTLFLGFTIGMNESDFENHIQKLRKENNTLDYSYSNRISTFAGKFDLGSGYTFKTSISTEVDGKTITGSGQYFLEPVYNINGGLMKLNIVPIEKWNGDYGLNKPNWLEDKIAENSERLKDKDLKQALIDNEFIDKYDFVRQKGDLIIYETTLTINYIDLKTLLLEFLIKETEKEIIKEDNEDIKF